MRIASTRISANCGGGHSPRRSCTLQGAAGWKPARLATERVAELGHRGALKGGGATWDPKVDRRARDDRLGDANGAQQASPEHEVGKGAAVDDNCFGVVDCRTRGDPRRIEDAEQRGKVSGHPGDGRRHVVR